MRTILLVLAFAFSATCLPVMASTSTDAHVYLSTAKGTYAYDASSTGKLISIEGSPFKTEGSLVGVNDTHAVTLGWGLVRSYELKAGGGIGRETSQMNVSHYTGGECYSPKVAPSAELDHAGRYLYVSLINNACDALQTYEISNTGFLTFKGASLFNDVFRNSPGGFETLPTLTGNDEIGAGLEVTPAQCTPYFGEFIREGGGTLNYTGGVWTDPVTQQPGWYYEPLGPIANDSTNHLAVATRQVQANFPDCGVSGPTQLASYTATHSGVDVGLITSNSWDNMPTVSGGVHSMMLNQAGKVLAVATGTGVQFFHFDGAKPITTFTGILCISGSITQLAWDDTDHLYALSAQGKMHVYAVTSTKVKELPGSQTQVPPGPFIVHSN